MPWSPPPLLAAGAPARQTDEMPKRKHRWPQFSLGSLFLVVTALCVGLAFVAVPAERQRQAVAAVQALGGWVQYVEFGETESNARLKTYLRRWLPRDYFDDVQAIDLESRKVTDADLANLESLKHLQTLNLRGTEVTDAGLVHLRGLTELRSLYLYRTQVTDTGAAQLQHALPNCRIGRYWLRRYAVDGAHPW